MLQLSSLHWEKPTSALIGDQSQFGSIPSKKTSEGWEIQVRNHVTNRIASFLFNPKHSTDSMWVYRAKNPLPNLDKLVIYR